MGRLMAKVAASFNCYWLTSPPLLLTKTQITGMTASTRGKVQVMALEIENDLRLNQYSGCHWHDFRYVTSRRARCRYDASHAHPSAPSMRALVFDGSCTLRMCF
jgi:hypothetical protein